MNTNEKNQKIIGTLILIIVLAGAFFLMRSKQPVETPEGSDAGSSASTTKTEIAGGTIGVTATGGYTIKEIPEASAPKAPDYNAPIVFSPSLNLTAEQKSVIEARAVASRATLAKEPANYTAWLALGRAHKDAGDYAQSAKIWTYLSLNWPTDAIALQNLGDLYMNFIRDYPKAEASYLGAIQRDVRQVNAYRNLFALYSTLYTTHASAAEDILKKGIQNNPEMLDLYVLLARHYRDQGRIAEARAEYSTAIIVAKGQTGAGATDIVADLEAEQAALK